MKKIYTLSFIAIFALVACENEETTIDSPQENISEAERNKYRFRFQKL